MALILSPGCQYGVHVLGCSDTGQHTRPSSPGSFVIAACVWIGPFFAYLYRLK